MRPSDEIDAPSSTPMRAVRRLRSNDLLWLLALLVVSVALIGATAFTYRNARVFALERLVRSAVLYTSGLESGARQLGPSVLERIDAFLEEAAGEEVRSVALIDRQGAVLAQTGEPALDAYSHSSWALDAAAGRVVTAGPPIGDVLLIAVPTSLGSGRAGRGRRGFGPHRGALHGHGSGQADRDWALILALDATEANEPVRHAQVQALFVGAALVLAWFLAWRWHRASRRARLLAIEARRQETLAALGEMAAVLAHEIRNPLGAIRGHAQLAVRGLDDDDRAARSLRTVIDETTRLSSLVESLLRYARPKPLEREAVELGALVDRVVALLVDSAASSGVVVERLDTGAGPVVRCDASQIEQVLINLIRNAIEAQPRGGLCVVAASIERGNVVVRVDDAGPGVPVESREEILAPFVTTRAEGSGLGLAIARQIAEGHGGRLVVESSELGGASFVLTFPLEEG